MTSYIEDTCLPSELETFERKYYEDQRKNVLTNQTIFNYAWCLIRSRFKGDVQRGITLMEDLSHNGDSDAQRDYLFYLTVGHFKLGELDRSLDCINQFLRVEPNNSQAKDLKEMITKKIRDNSVKGAAIVGGAGLLIGGVLALGMALSKK